MLLNGTTYSCGENLAKVLERIRIGQTRVTIVEGDTKTGKPWTDRPDSGRISRSMGPIKIPILIHNARCCGGPGLLESCILEIRHSNKKEGGVIYRHPKYKPSS